MSDLRLSQQLCESNLKRLQLAHQQWHGGYYWSADDQIKLMSAINYFSQIADDLHEKLKKEGKI